MADKPDYEVGHKRPPISTRFPPGVSGNSRGRPRGLTKSLPYNEVLGREVSITVDGEQRIVSAETAFAQHVYAQSLSRGGRIRKMVMAALENATRKRPTTRQRVITYELYPEPGEVEKPMRMLEMATLLSPGSPLAKWVIEPWIVQAALSRLDRHLTVEEQTVVIAATRKPHKVKWPDWWTVKG